MVCVMRTISSEANTTPQASMALRKEEAAEAGRELRALLRLLTHLTQRDLLDFGSAPDGPRVDVAQVHIASRVTTSASVYKC